MSGNKRRMLRSTISVAASVVLVASALGAVGTPAGAGQRWASPAKATIHPGVQTRTSAGQCTANFVFSDGKNVFIGQAAHCTSVGEDVFATSGCKTPGMPLGTRVRISGASRSGVLVYNSWLTMQRVKERSKNACWSNDFALVRIDPKDHARVNPSVPFWGGPRGIDSRSKAGDPVYSYGNSGLRLGTSRLAPQFGAAVRESAGGWTHDYYSVTPGVPGDSGAAVLGTNGGALGAVTLLYFVDPPAANGAVDLARALYYMRKHTSLDAIKLVNGTVRPSPLI